MANFISGALQQIQEMTGYEPQPLSVPAVGVISTNSSSCSMASYMASTRTAFIKVRHQVRPDRPVINGLLPQRGLVRVAGMILYFLCLL